MKSTVALLFFTSLFLPGTAGAQWQPGYASNGFFDGSPYCAVEYDGMLAIGGDFSGAGCAQSPGVVLTDLERFYPTGNQITFRYADYRTRGVRALLVYNGELVAGGDFDGWTGIPMRHIARLTQSGWVSWGEAYGEGILYGGPVFALAEFEGDLIAAGDFSSSRLSPSLPGIARWDGVQWQPMGSQTNPRAMTVWNGELYCGITRWDGTGWVPIADMEPEGSLVTAIAEVDEGLAFGGTFETLDGELYNGTAVFDGTAFRPLGDGVLTTIDPGFLDPEVGGVGGFASYRGVTYMQGPNYKQYQWYFGLAGLDDRDRWWPIPDFNWTNTEGNEGYVAVLQDRLVTLAGDSREFMDIAATGALQGAVFDGDSWSGLAQGLGVVVPPSAIHSSGGRSWVGVPGRGLLLQEGPSHGRLEIMPVVHELLALGDRILAAGHFVVGGHVVGQEPWFQAYDRDGTPEHPFNWYWAPFSPHFNGIRAIEPWRDGLLLIARSGEPEFEYWTPQFPDSFGLVWVDSAQLADPPFDPVEVVPLLEGEITALAIHQDRPWYARNGELYRVESSPGEGLAEVLVGTFNGEIEALSSNGARLFAGGTFTSVNALSSPHLAAFESGEWVSVPVPDGPVHVLQETGDGIVFVGGEFTNFGGALARNLAVLSGGTVGGFPQGPNGPVTQISVSETGVLVAGEFSEAGGLCADHLAEWVGDVRTVAIEERDDSTPRASRLQLLAPTPNPFNPRVTLAYDLPRAAAVRLRIFDLAGRLVATLEETTRDQGRHNVTWDGQNDRGEDVASGVYLARLEADGRVMTRKMSLLR